mmetsp:Transcript_20826/g.49450  ORF Transcript_20826/g.49450 Transcript_20826/m.49450 type:complete len:652 (-) Transcript_20826:117-2072(-)
MAMVAEEISPRMRRRVSSSQSSADESFFSGPSYEIPLAGEDEVEHSNSSRSRSNNSSSTSTRKSPPNDKSIRFSLHSASGLSSHLEEEEEAGYNDDEFASDEDDYSDSSNEFETTLLPPSSPGTGSVSPDDTIPTQYASSDSDSLGGGVGGDGRLRGISRSKSASASLSANPQSPTFSESKQRTLIKNNSSPRNSKISRIVSHNNRHKGNYYRDPGQVGSPGPIVTPRLVKIPSPRQQERKKTSSLLSHSDHSLDSIDCSYGDASIHGIDDCWRNNSNGSLSSPSSSSKPIFTVVSPNDGCGRSATIPIGGGRKVSISSIAVMAFCMLGLALYSNARTSLRYALTEVNELVDFSDKLHHQLTKADRDMRMLQRELAALDSIEQRREDDAVEERVLSQSSAFANPKLVEEMTNIQEKLKSSKTLSDKLKKQVVVLNKHDAEAKYGSGLIRVQMEIVFPTNDEKDSDDTNNSEGHTRMRAGGTAAAAAAESSANAQKKNDSNNDRQIIVMEMASLDQMPHSVYTFLEMVSNGLLNGCSFILNAVHELKAAPLPYDGSPPHEKAKAFLDHGLESVAFREYSPEFPHSQYTVGFAADGSPSFYINTEDNSAVHVGEPCFAKIVSGHDVVQRMNKMPTRNGIWLEQRIGIKEVTIL